LLIEDDVRNAQRVTQQLQRCGACGDLAHCSRLSSALALLAAQTFDVVITDLCLPDVSGLEAVTRLRAAAPDAALIALSAERDEALCLQLLRAGAQHCFVKGQLDRGSLRQELIQAVALWRQQRPPK
jgi:DNA-binding response OmpR family regulator